MWKEYKNTPLYINKERKSDCGIMWKGGEFDGDSPEYGENSLLRYIEVP